MDEQRARRDLVEAARHLERCGLNRGPSGNLSVRLADGLLITPSGIAPGDLGAEQMVALDAEGNPRDTHWEPSSEWRMHLALYRARPALAAVVHTHPPFATALACARVPIPALHYMVALAGGDTIPVAPYATFGTRALSDAVCATLERVDACLLANHGMVSAAGDLGAAVSLAEEVEHLARLYLLARQAGSPRVLDAAEMSRVRERFATYGRPAPRG